MAAKELITTVTVGSGVTSFDLTSIPQNYTDLYILLSFRNSGTNEHIKISINGSSANITGRYLTAGGGSTPGAGSYAQYLGNTTRDAYTANVYGNASVYITNYSSTTLNKVISSDTVAENNSSTANTTAQVIAGNSFASTAAITSISFSNEGASAYVAGSSASLYGIRKGSDGTTTVA